MAIPFALPSDEDAEDQSQQQLEQLMLDLYAALQQVLRARNSQHPSRNREYYFFFIFFILLSIGLLVAFFSPWGDAFVYGLR